MTLDDAERITGTADGLSCAEGPQHRPGVPDVTIADRWEQNRYLLFPQAARQTDAHSQIPEEVLYEQGDVRRAGTGPAVGPHREDAAPQAEGRGSSRAAAGRHQEQALEPAHH